MSINATVLSEIAYQLEKGNPWWAMALCNRHLPTSHFLRKAIARRFESRIGPTLATTELALQLLANTCDTASATEAIGARFPRMRRPIPSPRTRDRNTRLAIRKRPLTTRYSAPAFARSPYHSKPASATSAASFAGVGMVRERFSQIRPVNLVLTQRRIR